MGQLVFGDNYGGHIYMSDLMDNLYFFVSVLLTERPQ